MQEEVLWFQKARTKWLNDGDRNTSYYHVKTKVRRSRNRITMLKNDNNIWVEGKAACGALVNSFFKGLFKEEEKLRPWSVTGQKWPVMLASDVTLMVQPLGNEEIRQAIFSIGGLKSPGEDGFQAIFFQKCWDILGSSVCEAVKTLWSNPERIQEVNKTLVTLIPKVERPERVQQFRPISLCNVIYKCVSKIIVNRMKSSLTNLISPYQVSFVPRRNIHDNIIIVMKSLNAQKERAERLYGH